MVEEGYGSRNHLNENMVVQSNNIYPKQQSRYIYAFSKRCFDIIGAVVGILLLSPLFLVISCAIKITSPGTILYYGLRTGLYGKTFYIYKFRSMTTDADKGAGTTSRNDSRITSVGKILRKYKLDEIPQLFNVLLGSMSFVGPRPELPFYTEQYNNTQLLILTVRPGITDYSSLYFSNLNDLIGDSDPDNDFETKILPEKNKLRIKYVKERSFWLDIKLIIKTVFKIAKKI